MPKRKTMALFVLAGLFSACGGAQEPGAAKPGAGDMSARAQAFIDKYIGQREPAETDFAHKYWTATLSGNDDDYKKVQAAELKLRGIHQNRADFVELESIVKAKDQLPPLLKRQIDLAYLAYREDQIDPAMTRQMVELSSEIEQSFYKHRANVDGQELTDNDIIKILVEDNDSAKRKKAWEGVKQVGPVVADRVVKLAKLRNDAAKSLGFTDYWTMKVVLQEHDPRMVVALFEDLDKLTAEPFRKMKEKLDQELSQRFGVAVADLRPWHYADPFFQEAPPNPRLDLEQFFKNRPKEQLVELARKFYKDIGLDPDDIYARSDLYERKGKQQHAYAITMNRKEDIRILGNIQPSVRWMDTILHETGHTLYYKGIDRNLPYLLREAAHILTTEAVAMMFGALAKNGTWLEKYAGVAPDQFAKVADAAREQREREQLIFARWSLVMMTFERQLYANPDQDLTKLWWDTVEKYQLLHRPEGRTEPDWATKIHLVMAPVYYHNYIMGEMFAAQIRAKLSEMAGWKGRPSDLDFTGRRDFGEFLDREVFKPGMSIEWPALVEKSTGKALSPASFAAEFKAR